MIEEIADSSLNPQLPKPAGVIDPKMIWEQQKRREGQRNHFVIHDFDWKPDLSEKEKEGVGRFIYTFADEKVLYDRSTNPQWDSAHPDAFGN